MVTVKVCQNWTESSERRKALRDKLWISDKHPTGERQQLEKLVLQLDDAFALDDSKLSETVLIMQNIDTGKVIPVQTALRRLPYALRKELEDKMTSLLPTGCVEPSTRPYMHLL